MKNKGIIMLLFLSMLVFIMSLPVSASELTQSALPPNVNTDSMSYSIDLSDLPTFDITEYQQYLKVFEYYNIDVNNIIAVIPESEITGIDTDSNVEHRSGDIPGGVIVVSGQYLTPYSWKLIVTNAGILKINNMEADVRMFSPPYLPLLISQRVLGDLSLFGTVSETYTIPPLSLKYNIQL